MEEEGEGCFAAVLTHTLTHIHRMSLFQPGLLLLGLLPTACA